MKNIFFYWSVLFLFNTGVCFAQTPDIELVEQINSRYKIDQAVQTNIVSSFQNGASKEKIDELVKIQTETFKNHIPLLKRMIKNYGFPSFKLVGREASNQFFTMVQHADSDIEFQKSFLKKAKKFVRKKQFDARNFAYLTDRVNLNSGKPQIYGTQATYDENGQAVPKNLKDAENVNKRRATVGLETIEVYLQKLNELHKKQNTKN